MNAVIEYCGLLIVVAFELLIVAILLWFLMCIAEFCVSAWMRIRSK